MSWRTVAIENPARLSIKDNKLVIFSEEEIRIPIEDIDTLLLDSYGILCTQNLLSELAKNKVNTIICDEKHLPCASILPYSQASRGTKNANYQIHLAESTRKQLWRKNIMAKITNQATVLKKCELPYEDLLKLATTVRSGDVGNNESIAARIYFSRLLEYATRRKPTWHNAALNYGYAIVRSAIARSVASRGLVAMIGINHHSELNQYNLVDDLIESLRPFVDNYILSKVQPNHSSEDDDSSLNKEDRHLILDILNQNGIILDKKYQIRDICEIIVSNFVNAIEVDSTEPFILPKIIL